MEQFINAGGDSCVVPLFQSGDECDVLRDGEMREETSFLDNVSNTATEADGIGFGGGAAFDKDLPLRRDEQAIYEFEQRGFAAAAAAEKDDGFAAGNAQGDV